jgi:ligand-binding SRPBCC domain-containing protein
VPILLNMQAIVMPRFDHEARFLASAEAIFALLSDIARRPEWTPESMHLELAEPPAAVSAGSSCGWRVKRYGIAQRIVTTIEAIEPPTRWAERQTEGPFPLWRQETRLTVDGGETIVRDAIDFEPPRGMLGFVVTESYILADLQAAFAFRDETWRRLLQETKQNHEKAES